MKLIEQNWCFMDDVDGISILKRIEKIGRICYKSEELNLDYDLDKTKRFVKNLINRNHMSVLEHQNITVKIITDRAITHELVRHRIASYSQESQRFINYSKDKFGNEITFVLPHFEVNPSHPWHLACANAEKGYFELLAMGLKPEDARTVLPNSTKTEIYATLNLRAWRNFFELRANKAAHPMMYNLATDMLQTFKEKLPIFFDDINKEIE